MRKLIVLTFVLAIAVVGWLAWSFFFPGPDKIIRRQMAALAETATFGKNASAIARAAKAQKVVGMFAPDAQVAVDFQGFGARSFSSRDELSETAMGAFNFFRSLRVEFLDVSIQLAPGRQAADVGCTAKVFVGDSKDYAVQEMRFQFKKVDGHWLISKIETVKTLA